jgi:hypothetical protein
MSTFSKRLFLTIGWIGDPEFTPFIFTCVIDDELKATIAKFAKVRADVGADSIEAFVKPGLWSCYDDFTLPSNETELADTLACINADALTDVKTRLVIQNEGFYFETVPNGNYESTLSTCQVPFHCLQDDSTYHYDSEYLILSSARVLAREFNDEWAEFCSVNWEQAEYLVETLKAIPPDLIALMPDIKLIVDYADAKDEWDSGEVASWPELIIKAIGEFLRQPVPMDNK